MTKTQKTEKGVVLYYGRNWRRGSIEQNKISNIPKLEGKRVGLYILYKGKDIVYIGKSGRNLIGRLRQHNKNFDKSQWDYFTWFITNKTYTSDLEALIHHIFPDHRSIKLNRITARFVAAEKIPEKE
jgi:hypothetical protein